MMMSSLLDVTFSGFVVFGVPSFSIFINSWLLFLVLRSIMMVLVALLRMPWFGTKGGIVKTRAPSFRLIVDNATLPGPPGFLNSTWCTLYPLPITREDVAVWPYSVNILLEFSAFLASLHWPQGDTDLGKFGISYFELLLMFAI